MTTWNNEIAEARGLLARRRVIVTYDLIYRGANVIGVRDAISVWCEARGCALEVIALTVGVRFRLVGEQQTVRQAVGMVREWIRAAA